VDTFQKDPAVPDRSFPSVSVWMSVYSVDSCKITTNELNLTNGFFKKWGNTKFHVGNKEILSVTL
jgi:hypothetical protein